MPRTIWLRNGEVPPVGTLIKQPQLAHTLEVLGREGVDAFYKGSIAKQLVSQRAGHRRHLDAGGFRELQGAGTRARHRALPWRHASFPRHRLHPAAWRWSRR